MNSTMPARVKDCYRKKYQDLDKKVKRMAKRAKKDYIENLAEKAEAKWLQQEYALYHHEDTQSWI